MIDAIFDGIRAATGLSGAVLALAAIGLNVHYGYAGLLNFGQAGFMLVGAYGLAVTVSTFGGPLWMGLLVGLFASLVMTLILGLPTLRLRADYFAIVALAIAETLRLLVRSRPLESVMGGTNGLQRFGDGFYVLNPLPPGRYEFWIWNFSADGLFVLVVAWSLALLAALVTGYLIKTPWGRVVLALRENDEAPASVGKRGLRFKMQALMIGGLIGSVAGMVQALGQQAIVPDSFLPTITFFAFAAVILGGPGTTLGPVAGAMVFWFLLGASDSILSGVAQSNALISPQQVAAFRFILVGAGLLALVHFRPQGAFGRRAGYAAN